MAIRSSFFLNVHSRIHRNLQSNTEYYSIVPSHRYEKLWPLRNILPPRGLNSVNSSARPSWLEIPKRYSYVHKSPSRIYLYPVSRRTLVWLIKLFESSREQVWAFGAVKVTLLWRQRVRIALLRKQRNWSQDGHGGRVASFYCWTYPVVFRPCGFPTTQVQNMQKHPEEYQDENAKLPEVTVRPRQHSNRAAEGQVHVF